MRKKSGHQRARGNHDKVPAWIACLLHAVYHLAERSGNSQKARMVPIDYSDYMVFDRTNAVEEAAR